MKPEQVKTSVKNARTERAAGDAPNLGRVLKMPGTGLPKGEKRKRKKGARAKREGGRIVSNWMKLVGLVVALIVGIFIYSLVRFAKDKTEGTVAQRLVVDNVELKASKDSGPTSPSEGEAIAYVRAALGVRDPALVPKFFEAGNHSPEAIVEFLTGLEKSEGPITQINWLSNMDANGLKLEGVIVHFPKNDRPRSRIAFLIPNSKEGWRMDFESFARIENPSWQEMINNQVDQARLRVLLAADSYYNGPFRDDKIWVSYAIKSPDSIEILQGYCKVGSPQAAAIRSIISKGEKMNRATIEVRRVPDGLARQVEITRVLAEDWVMGPEPFDQLFD